MADNRIGNQSTFTKTDIETEGQQFCPCCQNQYVWDCGEDTENSPATLACGHLLCLSCIKTQWLDSTPQDGTVFCLTCTKRVTLVHLKTSDRYICEDKSDSSENLLSVRSVDDSVGVWTLEQKDSVSEWVSTNICENFVLKLISGTDSCLAGSAMTLDNSTSVTMMKHEIMPDNSLSPLKQEHHPEKTVMSYVVNKSNSEIIVTDNNFQNNSRGMPLQNTSLGSPDLNLKSLLQMLERNSLPSLGGTSSENNEMKINADNFNCIDITCKEEIQCLKKSHYEDNELEISSPVMQEKHLCEEMGVDDGWLPVGVVQNGSFITKGKIPKMQSYEGYFPNSEIISADDYICMTPMSRGVHEMDKVGVEAVPQLWFSQARRDFSHNNSSRSRRGRKRKPILRHCQSEYFARPYMKREHSPQLQLVKLVRQRALDKREEEEKAAISHEEKLHCKTEMAKRSIEDPELAFMKTVDMPSGKRVEDIYVVPSVWISNEKKNAGKPSCSREPMNLSGSEFCHFFPLDGAQRVPQPVYCHGNQTRFLNAYQTPCWKQVQGSLCGSQPPQGPSFSNPRKSIHSSLVSSAHSSKPAQNIYKVIRGHIITTLNAPKLDPVPSLRDLCKSALRLDAVAATPYLRHTNKYTSENQIPVHPSSQDETEASREMTSEIKTPKEFLDMQGSSTQHDLNFTDTENKTECSDKDCRHDESQTDQILQINSSSSMGLTNSRTFKFYDKTEKLSDNEDTLPENPLFTEEDITKTNTMTVLSIDPESCGENVQTKMTAKCKNAEQQLQNQSDIYSTSILTETSHVKDNFKSLYPTTSTVSKDNSSDYIIPIVSYRLTDTVKGRYIANQKSDNHNSEYIISQDHNDSKKYDIGSISISNHESSSFPIIEDPYCDDTFEGDLTSLPSLVSITKEIRSLASTEPLNKPLANLTASLNLLCNAEKSLFNSNFALYKQVKSETKSKLGRLSLCIRKLGDMIVTVGGTLQEWMKETSGRCFKTMRVLTDMYNSNIVALIELITPYFHHICELIASCHSQDISWSNKEASLYDQPTSLAAHLSSTSWLDSSADYQFSSSSCRPDTPNEQSASPKNYSSQDCHNLMSTKEGSDTSLSEPESSKDSPKGKELSSVKRRQPLSSNMGQGKTQISFLKNKQVSLVESRQNKTTFSDLKFCEITSGQSSMLLPNTVLVKMHSDCLWGEENASAIHGASNVISRLISSNVSGDQISFEKADSQIVEIPTSASSWMMPSTASDSCHSIPVQMSLSEESNKTTLSLLDSDLNSIIDDPDMSSVGDLKDTSSECSPNKKIKFEHDDTSAYSNIVVALPEGIKIVVSNASSQNAAATATCTTNTLPLSETALDSLNICSADLHSFQNIYFIHNPDNPDDYLQLDPAQLSNALLNTFKGSKDVHENIGITFVQNDQGNTLDRDIKEEVAESELVG